MPMKMTEPIPADIRPGNRIRGSIGPPSPAASMRMIAPMTGEPKMVAIAANAALAASTVLTGSGCFLARWTARMARRGAEGDERGFWSQHQTEAEGGQRGQQDARQLGRGRAVPALSPS